jgi:hypothetical protein
MTDISRDFLFNYTYPHVIEIVDRINHPHFPSLMGHKFIIKGGASVKHHLDMNGIFSGGITFDIDIAPLFLPQDGYTYSSDPTYVQNAVTYNTELYGSIEKKLNHQARVDGLNLYFNMKSHNGLITMQIKINDSQYYDIIDFSYIDPSDDASTFVNAILKLHGSLEHFVTSFDGIFSDVQTELCVAMFGHDLYESYMSSTDSWMQSLELLRGQALNAQRIKDLGLSDDDDDAQLEIILKMIASYEHQLSDEYISKLRDKLLRFKRKILGLELIGGNKDVCLA